MKFNITVQPSGAAFRADAVEPVLTHAIEQNVTLPYGCRDGSCGTCKCRLIQGRVEHGPHQVSALDDREEADGWILPCCATAHSDLVIENTRVLAAQQFPVQQMPVRVTTIERSASDVMELTLQLPAANPLRFHPGQYIDLILRDGTRRSFSIANAPEPGQGAASIELHLRHMPGGVFTGWLFDHLKARDLLRIEGPHGTFFLREDRTGPIILLASGTGFAPVQALLQRLQQLGVPREVHLYWGGRKRTDLYAHARLQAWLDAALPWVTYVPVLSEPLPEDGWRGRTGFVHAAVAADFPDLSRHAVYACGAPAMIEAAWTDFTMHRGLPPEQFFADSFVPSGAKAA